MEKVYEELNFKNIIGVAMVDPIEVLANVPISVNHVSYYNQIRLLEIR